MQATVKWISQSFMLSFLGFSIVSIRTRSQALQVLKGRLLLRTMYVFLPVHFFRSFNASFSENLEMLNVYFFIDSPSSLSPVAAALFSEATPAQKSQRYRVRTHLRSRWSLQQCRVSSLLSFLFSLKESGEKLLLGDCWDCCFRCQMNLRRIGMRFHWSRHAQHPPFHWRTQ